VVLLLWVRIEGGDRVFYFDKTTRAWIPSLIWVVDSSSLVFWITMFVSSHFCYFSVDLFCSTFCVCNHVSGKIFITIQLPSTSRQAGISRFTSNYYYNTLIMVKLKSIFDLITNPNTTMQKPVLYCPTQLVVLRYLLFNLYHSINFGRNPN